LAVAVVPRLLKPVVRAQALRRNIVTRIAAALLGVDRYGADLEQDGTRTRFVFGDAKLNTETLHAALEDCIQRHAN
jgi:hypothetical protein